MKTEDRPEAKPSGDRYHEKFESGRLFYDWKQMNYADIAEYNGLATVATMSGLLDMSDTTIAGNSYLLTSDIIIGSES